MKTFTRYLGRTVAGALLASGLAAIAATAQAAILPDTIGYEGYLRDGATPVNAAQDITFRIYDQQAGGNLLWTEPHTAVAVVNGVFQVRLGSIISLSDDTSGIQFDRPLFLSVQVAGNEEMSPRLALNLSPYSFAGRLLESTVSVDCGSGGSIAQVLDEAADTFALEIDISGNCIGNLHIDRDKVTIKSTDGTGVITGVTGADIPGNAVVRVTGVQNVVLDNVKVQGEPGDNSSGMRGILLADTGQLTVRNGSIVRNHNGDGILAVETSSLDVWGSTIENSGRHGINVFSGSHADIEQESVVQNSGANGINVALSSSADVKNSTIKNNADNGIAASWGAAVRVLESTLQDNGTAGGNFDFGLMVNEGASARVEDSTITSAMSNGRDGGAIVVIRGSSLRLRGENTISAPASFSAVCPPDCPTNGTAAGGKAIEVGHASSLRQDGGKSTITGQVQTYNLSTADLRDAEITGLAVSATGGSATLNLRDQSPTDDAPTVNGTLVISGTSEMGINNAGSSERAIINGNMYCRNSDAPVPNNIQFHSATQGYLNCANANTDIAMEIAGPVGDVSNTGSFESPTTVTYTVTVNNPAIPLVEVFDTNININLNGVGLFDMTIQSVSDSGNCGFGGASLWCTVPRIAGGTNYQFTFDVELPPENSGDFEVNGSAWPKNPDTGGENNNDSELTSVIL